jgi:hypothetical protein
MRALIRLAAAALVALSALGAFAQDNPKYELRITAPEDGDIVSDVADVLVRVTVAPPLKDGDRVQLLLDGMPVAPSTVPLDFTLSDMARGMHLLQVVIIDATNNVGSMSPSNTLFVLSGIPGISYPR